MIIIYSKIKTCILNGLDGNIVEVESYLSNGLPQFNIVGLADKSIKESTERVRAAIQNSGYTFPLKRITINLVPADLRKEGSQLDLAIAISILKASEVIYEEIGEEIAFLGELTLDGRIKGIKGALPMVISLRELGIKKVIVPYENRKESAVIHDVEIIPVKYLIELVEYLNDERKIERYTINENEYREDIEHQLDFSDIKGQKGLKRALEIAAAGFHNILIVGPPGSGKTMAAERLPTILPQLELEEAIETTKIYSISGELKENKLLRRRPFRAPHHTASSTSLIGGGRIPRPGEISLAHNGVLFLDEMPEFNRNVLEVLRQPLESGEVTISRANATLTYPSNFLLVGSMNPCPCGNYGNPTVECTCSQRAVDNYLNKLSSPLLDRIDLHIDVNPVKYEDLSKVSEEESSLQIKERVTKAREMQIRRFKGHDINFNSEIPDGKIKEFCKLDKESKKLLEIAFKKYGFSARIYKKVLKISRTIADLELSEDIKDNHVLEAIKYRTLEKSYW